MGRCQSEKSAVKGGTVLKDLTLSELEQRILNLSATTPRNAYSGNYMTPNSFCDAYSTELEEERSAMLI